MVKTQSERLFENYCADARVLCERISEEDSKTPDYELRIHGQRIVVEVKEFSRNEAERESDRLLSERGYGSALSNTPGDRVRKKIADSSAQIKAGTQGIYPSILVLFDRGQVAGHLDPYNIRVAMYGLEQVHIAVPRDTAVSPYVTGISYGPKRKMTEEHNTSKGGIHFALVHPHCNGWAGWQRIPSRVVIIQPRWSNSTSGCPPRRPAATVSSEFAGPRASSAQPAARRRLGAPGGGSSEARSASARPLQRQARSSRALGNRGAHGATRCGTSRVRRRA